MEERVGRDRDLRLHVHHPVPPRIRDLSPLRDSSRHAGHTLCAHRFDDQGVDLLCCALVHGSTLLLLPYAQRCRSRSASPARSCTIVAAGSTRLTSPTDSPAQRDIASTAPVTLLSGTP